ncbi:MAG: hypothetical protein AAFN51_12300, partial [Pseudomonadota bacterium]
MPDVKVVLHLGAHKTASTYLQARLAKSSNRLRQMQVGYVDLKTFREVVSRAGGLRRCQHRYAMLSQRTLRAELSGLIRRENILGAERVVLSDENILGHLGDLSNAGKFYPTAGPRLRVVREALRDWDLEIVVSVRDYVTFLPSVWSHMVLRDGFRPFSPQVARSFLTGGRGWAEVLQDLQRAAPGVPLHLWTFEEFAKLEADVLETLVGPVPRSAIDPVKRHAMPGLSGAAVERIEDLIRNGQMPSPDRVREISREFAKAKGHLPYIPWAEDVASGLGACYAT